MGVLVESQKEKFMYYFPHFPGKKETTAPISSGRFETSAPKLTPERRVKSEKFVLCW